MQNKKIRSEAATLRKEEETRFMQQLPQPRPPRGMPPSKNPNCNCELGVDSCEMSGKCLKEKDVKLNHIEREGCCLQCESHKTG